MKSLGTPSSLPYKGTTIAWYRGKRIRVSAFQLYLLREGNRIEIEWQKEVRNK
jgi:hypothetical protein